MTIERITLFHSNDIHSCFDYWPNIVSHIKQNRDKHTLYFDLGDHADRSHPLTEATVGKGNTTLLNDAGVDYATIGNNEGVTFTKEQLDSLYEDATFPVVVANLFYPDGRRPSWANEIKIHTLDNGLKIGIIGLTAPFQIFYEQLGWMIAPPKDILKLLLPKVQKQADIIVLLSHLGLFQDEKIAEEFTGIDVIIGAHTHHVLPEGKRVKNTLLAQTGKHGVFLGKVIVDYDSNDKNVVKSEASLIDTKKESADDNTYKLLKCLNTEANSILAECVATIPRQMPVKWQETTEGVQLLCDALTEWCEEDIGMMNAGVLLDSIEKGRITKGDIHRLCPHPINPCVVKVTGEQLQMTIERAFSDEMRNLELKGFGFRGKVLGRMIFTGIDIQFNEDQTIGHIHVLGNELEMNQVYSLATLDMYTFGHLLPAISAAKEKKYLMPEFLRDILAWKLKQMWP
ncbi:bifunctional metallophosphatase/5'-nucleotidase [bacterium LRH843]|nr:bifunctional metallophosphatase/5'-nucleotidase [bacterium LRH843]